MQRMQILKSKKEWVNVIKITLGSLFLASGMAYFLIPAQITTGGSPGIAILLHFFTGLSTGLLMMMINIPLLALGARYMGPSFSLRSVYAIILSSLLVDYLPVVYNTQLTDSLLLSTIYGGLLIGLGVGLILSGNASAGGSTVIARIASGLWAFRPAHVILIIDVLIILATGVLFSDMELALWSMLSIYSAARVMDKVLTGIVHEKIVHIVSHKADEMGEKIAKQFERDGTILSGHNLTDQESKTILFVMISARKIPLLKSLVLDIDPKAIMVVMEASEMVGSSIRR